MKHKKIVIINANLHRVYWGWYRALVEFYGRDNIFLISLPDNIKPVEIGILKNHIIELKNEVILFKKYRIRFPNLTNILKKIDPDIILSKIIFEPYTFEAINYAHKYNKKIVLFEEMSHYYPNNVFFKILSEIYINNIVKRRVKSIPIIATTRLCYDFLLKENFFNVVYIPYSFWKYEFKIKSHPQDKLRLLYVGKLSPYKNILYLLKTIEYLKNKKLFFNTDFKLTIVGGGPLKNQLINYINEKNLRDLIELKGYIPNNQLDDIFKVHNVFILPSLREPVGLVVLEAMYNSLPIIVSKNAGAEQYVLDYFNGFKIDPIKINTLIEALIKLKNRKLREIMSKNSYKIIKESFNYKFIGNYLIDFIEKSL